MDAALLGFHRGGFRLALFKKFYQIAAIPIGALAQHFAKDRTIGKFISDPFIPCFGSRPLVFEKAVFLMNLALPYDGRGLWRR